MVVLEKSFSSPGLQSFTVCQIVLPTSIDLMETSLRGLNRKHPILIALPILSKCYFDEHTLINQPFRRHPSNSSSKHSYATTAATAPLLPPINPSSTASTAGNPLTAAVGGTSVPPPVTTSTPRKGSAARNSEFPFTQEEQVLITRIKINSHSIFFSCNSSRLPSTKSKSPLLLTSDF